jgi:hypothetical protein
MTLAHWLSEGIMPSASRQGCWIERRSVRQHQFYGLGFRVCVYYCRTYYKAVCGGGRGTVKDMCYEIRRAEACVD